MSMENTYLAHYGVKGMKWGVRRTPEQLGQRYKSDGSRIAKAGLENDFAKKSGVAYGLYSHSFFNPSRTSKARRKSNARATKDKELRRLNKEVVSAEQTFGENSAEAKAARAKFHNRGQELAVRNIKALRRAYVKDAKIGRLSSEGKKKLEQQMADEVYLGPANWYNNMERSYAKALGVPRRL